MADRVGMRGQGDQCHQAGGPGVRGGDRLAGVECALVVGLAGQAVVEQLLTEPDDDGLGTRSRVGPRIWMADAHAAGRFTTRRVLDLAALRYQLRDEDRRPRFAPVFLDEGFIKSDSEFAGRSVLAWKKLGFQLIVGAPLDKVTALEPAMRLILTVTSGSPS